MKETWSLLGPNTAKSLTLSSLVKRVSSTLGIILCLCSIGETHPDKLPTNANIVAVVNGSRLPSTRTSVVDDYSYEDEEIQNYQTGQIFVFVAVIFISLGGILLKYFVTQYETAQIKAHEQLNYSRISNQIS